VSSVAHRTSCPGRPGSLLNDLDMVSRLSPAQTQLIFCSATSVGSEKQVCVRSSSSVLIATVTDQVEQVLALPGDCLDSPAVFIVQLELVRLPVAAAASKGRLRSFKD
jgi:hypothetical protein